MLNYFDLINFKTAAIADYSKDSLVDLRDVKIDSGKSVPEKMNEYFEQIKNPYLFKVGDMRVKLSFGGERSFTDALGAVISNGANYQTNLGLFKVEVMVYYCPVEKRPYLHIGGRSNSVKIKYGGFCYGKF